MIEVTCDKCERVFGVDDESRGQKVACPTCGDVTFAGERPPGSSRAGEPRAGAARKSDPREPERELCVVRQAMMRANPIQFFGLGVVGLGGLIMGALVVSSGAYPLAILLGLLGLASMIWLATWYVRTLDAKLIVTTKRTIARTGLLSKRTTEILHRDIRNFTMTQSFWERVWGVGTIGISSAAEDDTEIVMRDVPRPKDIHALIDLYRPL